MATLAVALLVLYASLAFGAGVIAQFRRTGSTDFRGISGRPGSPGWLGGVLFVAATGLVLAAPCSTLRGPPDRSPPSTGRRRTRSGSPRAPSASREHSSRSGRWGLPGASAWMLLVEQIS